ncbi:MAG TPA: hypothetical protein VGK73_34365 [Polyangiaceae bacterium]
MNALWGLVRGVVILLAVWVTPSAARADVTACVDAHGNGQIRRDDGDYVGAVALFQGCVDPSCPRPIRQECTGFLQELEPKTSTVVLGARDESGADLPDVSVDVDGKPLLERLTGLATPVNPGQRVFTFRRASGAETKVTVLVLEGAKGREIVGTFAAPREAKPVPMAPDAPPASAGQGRKTIAYVLAGGALVALGSFAYFAASGSAKEKELRDTCAPSCSESDANAVGTQYLIADVSLVLAAGLLGGSAYFYFTAPTEPKTGERGLVLGMRGRF